MDIEQDYHSVQKAQVDYDIAIIHANEDTQDALEFKTHLITNVFASLR